MAHLVNFEVLVVLFLYILLPLTISGIHPNKVNCSFTTPVKLSHFGISLWVHLVDLESCTPLLHLYIVFAKKRPKVLEVLERHLIREK